MDQQPPSFDTNAAANLFPQLVQLIQAAALQQKSTPEDPDARVAKVEVGKQVSGALYVVGRATRAESTA